MHERAAHPAQQPERLKRLKRLTGALGMVAQPAQAGRDQAVQPAPCVRLVAAPP